MDIGLISWLVKDRGGTLQRISQMPGRRRFTTGLLIFWKQLALPGERRTKYQ